MVGGVSLGMCLPCGSVLVSAERARRGRALAASAWSAV
jgi:hypothetical protein